MNGIFPLCRLHCESITALSAFSRTHWHARAHRRQPSLRCECVQWKTLLYFFVSSACVRVGESERMYKILIASVCVTFFITNKRVLCEQLQIIFINSFQVEMLLTMLASSIQWHAENANVSTSAFRFSILCHGKQHTADFASAASVGCCLYSFAFAAISHSMRLVHVIRPFRRHTILNSNSSEIIFLFSSCYFAAACLRAGLVLTL